MLFNYFFSLNSFKIFPELKKNNLTKNKTPTNFLVQSENQKYILILR